MQPAAVHIALLVLFVFTGSAVTQVCEDIPFDIIFILDDSATLNASDHAKVIDFVASLVNISAIGPDNTQIGLVTFSDRVYVSFDLNTYSDKQSVLDALNQTNHDGTGDSNAAQALTYALDFGFTTSKGVRANAAHIAIFLSAGQSLDTATTLAQAGKLKAQGVTLFALGLGPGANFRELNNIASDNSYAFALNSTDDLEMLRETLYEKVCKIDVPTCGGHADIVFLLDQSGSIGQANFQKMLEFVRHIITVFKIGPNDIQIGVDTFSSNYYQEITLNQYSDKTRLLDAVSAIHFKGGGTNTGWALQNMRYGSFKTSAGHRQNVPKIAVVMTDGRSNSYSYTLQEANRNQEAGINTLAVGIGSGVNVDELKAIATDPDEENVLEAINFDTLSSIEGFISSKTCRKLEQICGVRADVVLLIDSSGSVGRRNFKILLDFVQSIVEDLEVGSDQIRVAVAKYNHRAYSEFHLNRFSNKRDILDAIVAINYIGGSTNTAGGIDYVDNIMFQTRNGDRPEVPNVAIVITDGKSNNQQRTRVAAQNARDNNVTIFSVGIGSDVSFTELKDIATDPDRSHVLTIGDFEDLVTIKSAFKTQTCQAIPLVLPPYVSPPPTAPEQAPDPCQDSITNCALYDPSVCSAYSKWANTNCRRTCSFCTPQVPASVPPCEDKDSNCNSKPVGVCVGATQNWAMQNCRKFCGFCNPGSQTGGYFNKCFYRGRSYDQGETWEDGCSYECECIDASRGQYTCYNKCPIYYNLPPMCTLVRKLGKCCLEPVCNFNMGYTNMIRQNLGSYLGNFVCTYGDRAYFQGQAWSVGCEYDCICNAAYKGEYSCQNKCPRYYNLPSICKLKKFPDECCPVPLCQFDSQIGSFSGSGGASGSGSDIMSNKTGVNPSNMCVFKGKSFKQDDTWFDGCDRVCVCDDAFYGFIRCDERCPKYLNLPPGCVEVTVPGECCKSLSCTSPGTFVYSQTQYGTVGAAPTSYPVPKSNLYPTLPPGTPYAPGQNPNVSPGTPSSGYTLAPGQEQSPSQASVVAPPKLSGCVFKGNVYKQGQRWVDGCFTCVCFDERSSRYNCNSRCPSFANLDPRCTLKMDPNDTCCMLPDCPSQPGVPDDQSNFTVVVKSDKGYSGFSPAEPPTPVEPTPTNDLPINVKPEGTSPVAPPYGCIFGGQNYTQGETWEIGCDLSCHCQDAANGNYLCTERCPKFGPLPKGCFLVPDPTDSCCKKVECGYVSVGPVFAKDPVFVEGTCLDELAKCTTRYFDFADACGLGYWVNQDLVCRDLQRFMTCAINMPCRLSHEQKLDLISETNTRFREKGVNCLCTSS